MMKKRKQFSLILIGLILSLLSCNAPNRAENEISKNKPEIKSEPSAQVQKGETIYKGTTDINDDWINAYGGQVLSDEIIIIISKDGAISGSLYSLWENGVSEPISWETESKELHYCVSNILLISEGIISGKETEEDKHFNIKITQQKIIERLDCPAGDEETTEVSSHRANYVYTDKDKYYIDGRALNFFSFSANRQKSPNW